MAKHVPVTEAARAAGISPERVRRLFHSGHLAGQMVAGRVLVDPTRVAAALRAARRARAASTEQEPEPSAA